MKKLREELPSDIHVSMVPLEGLGRTWSMFAPFIEMALEAGENRASMENIVRDIVSGYLTMWVIFSDEPLGACLCRVIEDNAGKTLVIEDVGGKDAHLWLSGLEKTLAEYAKDIGCSHIDVIGRKEWQLLGKSRGYELHSIRIRRKLEESE